MTPYTDWRSNVEATETIRRFHFLWNAGHGYNFRLWHQHPRLTRPVMGTKYQHDPAKLGETIRVTLPETPLHG